MVDLDVCWQCWAVIDAEDTIRHQEWHAWLEEKLRGPSE